MLDKKPDLFSIWENLKLEKKLAAEKGLSEIKKKDVLIVDGMNAFLRCYMAMPTMNDNGEHVGGIAGCLKSIGNAIKMFSPDRCIIVFDGVGGSLKRRKIYSDYKAHRKSKIRLNRTYEGTSLDDSDMSLKKQLLRMLVYLQKLPVNVIAIDNVEADDTIAYLALDTFKDWNVTVMSADKDFLQIVNVHIKVWSPTKKRIYSENDILNEYGITSKNFVYFRALCGDDSDNIPGIKGCGLKTVIKAFPMLGQIDTNIELKSLYDHSIASGDRLKVYTNIVQNWSDVERNYALMQLSDTALTTITQLHINEVLNNPITKLNRFELSKLLGEDRMLNNIPNFPTWVSECFSKLNSFVRD